ncbi:MAG: Crp/Fnr family transcriptional regulator [Butyricicoccus sp.]|jgi:CRP-like cAMP-binding protein
MMENILASTALFHEMTAEEIRRLLPCLRAEKKTAARGEVILQAGGKTKRMGLVLSGSVRIEKNDLWGNKSVLSRVMPGEVFAETYALCREESMPVCAVAAERSEILLLDAERIVSPCDSNCPHHRTLIRNLLMESVQKNLQLSRRIFYTSSKTIRGRVLSYLSDLALRQGSTEVVIPFNRQELADYLSVDRSALSAELSRMQRDGLLTVCKNRFVLYQPQDEI